MNQLQAFLKGYPRASLAPLDTPIQELTFVKDRYPDGPRVFIKRDDFIGPLVWGNKLRKLEYVVGYARKHGYDTLITTGGIQSNHSRTTAQVARQEGLHCHLVLNGEKPKVPRGNYLVNTLLEIPMHLVPERKDRQPKMEQLKAELEQKGHKVLLVPLGASDQIGTLGFIQARQELEAQLTSPPVNYIIHASSSGGTQAGLLLGNKLLNSVTNIIGISADSTRSELYDSIKLATDPLCEEQNMDNPIKYEDVLVDTSCIGAGYGIPTEESREAARLLALYAGILTDQTYSAKAFAGILRKIENDDFKPDESILFWHTGGTMALF